MDLGNSEQKGLVCLGPDLGILKYEGLIICHRCSFLTKVNEYVLTP